MNDKLKSGSFYLIYLGLLSLPCLEIALLILGYRPYQQVDFRIAASPEQCLIADPRLGFALRPGTFQVTINGGLTYSVTHGEDGSRITANTPNKEEVPAIWFMGCSYTYGMGIADSLTFPFLINQKLPDYTTNNFGVPGYGTVQGLLQLEQKFAFSPLPEIVVFNYADFHDDRNALTPSYRRDLFMGYQRSNVAVKALMREAAVPFVEAGPAGYQLKFCTWDSIYQNWEYREKFATINFLQDLSDQRQSRSIDQEAITRYLFQTIKAFCDRHGVRLIVTGLTPSPKTDRLLQHLATSGFETLDIAVDLRRDKYRNAPYDDHPNARANAIFAERIIDYLSH